MKIEVVGEHGSQLEVIGSSVGGGRIRICEIDGIRTDFSGEYNTIIVHNTDTPGHVAQVTTVLAQKNVNIAAMQLYRNTKGGYAVMILECDDRIPPDMVRWLSGLDGILKITSYNAEEDV
ncbi:MAG: ACT domain-containing protein [Ruminococcus callidus]